MSDSLSAPARAQGDPPARRLRRRGGVCESRPTSLFGDFIQSVGALFGGAHLPYSKDFEDGVLVRMTVDLEPIHEDGLTGGDLVELWGILDERHTPPAADTPLRFDINEADLIADDDVVSLLGTGAVGRDGVPTEPRATTNAVLPDDTDLAAFVEEHKRTVPAFDQALLVIEEPVRAGGQGSRRTHVITWWRVPAVSDLLSKGELYCTLDVDDGVLRAASPKLKVASAPAGVALRLRGTATDVEPFDAATPEPLADLPVTLAGRRAVTGDTGAFVLDARLGVSDHPLAIARPGIEAVELTVETTANAAGVVTVAVHVDGNELATATTPAPATEATVLELTLPAPIAIRAHKLRGTVLWPDSRTGDVAVAYHGTPLAERHVYVLPLPDAGSLTALRPTSTRAWEALRRRPDVLRSARPGTPALRERTAFDGLFEVKYVDFTAGRRYFIWSERLDPVTPGDVRTESPDHVVRTFRQELIQLTANNLAEHGNAGNLARLHRNLVDHEYNLTRDTVPWGLDVLQVADFPAPDGRTLVRPSRTRRNDWDGLPALEPGVGLDTPVPASLIATGLELQVLPLVPLGESEELQAAVVKRASKALADCAAQAFPNGYDAGAVRFALDAARLVNVIDLKAGAWDPVTVNPDARRVELLERTFVVRPQLARGGRLGVDQARWQMDAITLADDAFVQVPQAKPVIAERRLDPGVAGAGSDPTHVPVLAAVAPLLPGLAPRRVYLAPGHGLYPVRGSQASVAPGHWESPRGGWSANAGEDDIDLLMASLTRDILTRNQADVRAPRGLLDFTAAGVSNPAAGVFQPVADPDFPRLWQQNAVYYLGATGEAVVLNDPNFPAPAGNKDDDGINSRIAHMRSLAAAPAQIDLVLSMHTNAGGGAVRGTSVEYLNVTPAAGRAGEGNPLGLALATRVLAETQARTHLRSFSLGVMTMTVASTIAVLDLVETFDHWVLNAAVPDVDKQRVANQPAPNPGGRPKWVAMPFPTVGPALRIPVALSEAGFHDHPEDASLLSRAWFRRLVAEGNAIAIDAQLRDSATAATRDDVRAVLTRLVGDQAALRALPAGPAAATAADVQAAIQAVGDPGAVVADPSYATLTMTALGAARSQTRLGLVEALRDRLATIAGFPAAGQDPAIDTFVTGALLGGAGIAALERAGEPPTRAEAGVLACRAVGITPASLASAQTLPVGKPPQTLLLPVPGTGDEYCSAIETALLAAQIGRLEPEDVYRVADAFLADASWARLDTPRGSDTYELHPGTPLIVVVETRGAAWNAPLEDVTIKVDAGRDDIKLACAKRDGVRAVSEIWALDFRTREEPAEVSIELFVKHPRKRELSVGVKKLQLKVPEPVALPV